VHARSRRSTSVRLEPVVDVGANPPRFGTTAGEEEQDEGEANRHGALHHTATRDDQPVELHTGVHYRFVGVLQTNRVYPETINNPLISTTPAVNGVEQERQAG
jgi:hypothetical protein